MLTERDDQNISAHTNEQEIIFIQSDDWSV